MKQSLERVSWQFPLPCNAGEAPLYATAHFEIDYDNNTVSVKSSIPIGIEMKCNTINAQDYVVVIKKLMDKFSEFITEKTT